jgi:hypothetical protein
MRCCSIWCCTRCRMAWICLGPRCTVCSPRWMLLAPVCRPAQAAQQQIQGEAPEMRALSSRLVPRIAPRQGENGSLPGGSPGGWASWHPWQLPSRLTAVLAVFCVTRTLLDALGDVACVVGDDLRPPPPQLRISQHLRRAGFQFMCPLPASGRLQALAKQCTIVYSPINVGWRKGLTVLVCLGPRPRPTPPAAGVPSSAVPLQIGVSTAQAAHLRCCLCAPSNGAPDSAGHCGQLPAQAGKRRLSPGVAGRPGLLIVGFLLIAEQVLA